MIIINDQLITIKRYSITELAFFYGVNYRTLQKWIKPFQELVGEKIGRFYTVDQVIIIFDKIKIPCKGIIENNINETKEYYINTSNKIITINKNSL